MSRLILLLLLFSNVAFAENHYLRYQYNEKVEIVISNVACNFPRIKDEYPFAVGAFRIDGQAIGGCYKKKDENNIEIQWYKGDKSVLPANAFLQPKMIEAKPAEPSL